MSQSGRPLTPIPLQAHPVSAQANAKATELPKEFNVQGMVALPKSKQFALFGQLRAKDGNHGYIEYCDKETKVTHQITTNGSVIWHATVLPRFAGSEQIAILEDNHNDHPKSPNDAIRHRVVDSQSPKASAAATSPKGKTWIPGFVTAPTAQIVPGVAGEKAWRIKLKDRKVEQHHALLPNKSLPVPTSAQYFAYSPNGRFLLAGCGADETVALLTCNRERAFTIARRLPIIKSQDFLAATWLSDSNHYVISTVRHGLVLGNVRYPSAVATTSMHSPVHAALALPNSATLITSHHDGSVHVYDMEEQLDRQTNKARPNATLLTRLKAGLFGRKNVFIDIAALSDLHETTIMMHERGTHTIERITLRHIKEWRDRKNAWNNLQEELNAIFKTDPAIAYKLLSIIQEYTRFYISPIQRDVTQDAVIPDDNPAPKLI